MSRRRPKSDGPWILYGKKPSDPDRLVTPPDKTITIAEVKAYRERHGVSLKEACDAVGWRGYRIEPLSEQHAERDSKNKKEVGHG